MLLDVDIIQHELHGQKQLVRGFMRSGMGEQEVAIVQTHGVLLNMVIANTHTVTNQHVQNAATIPLGLQQLDNRQ